ncbi:MAG TPA: NAD(P)-dependent oxidoreductase [Candidatus Saccharimonadales bacterium]|nr:NAD(P)-dependent oxidoreductase [Candidatus Saccharimonadales bacterium]
MRIAVTGSSGRLGRSLMEALGDAPFAGPFGPIAWTRAEFDLDAPAAIGQRIERDRIECVVHASAWTDVDGCARDPELALRRNGVATAVLAAACASRGVDLVAVSTNEVFDGHRTDGRGYVAGDEPNPINPYGASKLAGERGAREAFERLAGVRIGPREGEASSIPGSAQLAIVRTAWLFGPPGNDFPAKVLAAAERARASGMPLKVVGDEIGSPTFTADLAAAIVELLGSGAFSGLHHIVNAGAVSRAGWARELFRQARVAVEIEEVPASTWPRASAPPAWAVLEPTPLPGGEPLEPWQAALARYLPSLLRAASRP